MSHPWPNGTHVSIVRADLPEKDLPEAGVRPRLERLFDPLEVIGDVTSVVTDEWNPNRHVTVIVVVAV